MRLRAPYRCARLNGLTKTVVAHVLGLAATRSVG